MSKIINLGGYVENGQFAGGISLTAPYLSGSAFLNATETYGGLYVGEAGNITVKTVDGSVLTFVSASGFIPGLISAVSSSTTAASIIALR
jgi:hypothetical protein